jgi:hypothetical protein
MYCRTERDDVFNFSIGAPFLAIRGNLAVQCSTYPGLGRFGTLRGLIISHISILAVVKEMKIGDLRRRLNLLGGRGENVENGGASQVT